MAVERTLPPVFAAYAVVVIWYLRHGEPTVAVRQAKVEAPLGALARGEGAR